MAGLNLPSENEYPSTFHMLHPTQMIPILFNHKIVNKLNGWFSSFIWCKRRPLIRMSVLQLPNAMDDQLSAHLRYVADWTKNNASSIWLDVERSLSLSLSQKIYWFLINLNVLKSFVATLLQLIQLEHRWSHSIWRPDQGLHRFSPQLLITLTFSQGPWTQLSNAGQLRVFLPFVTFLMVLHSWLKINLWKNKAYQEIISLLF